MSYTITKKKAETEMQTLFEDLEHTVSLKCYNVLRDDTYRAMGVARYFYFIDLITIEEYKVYKDMLYEYLNIAFEHGGVI